MGQLIHINEASERFGVSARTLRRYAENGTLRKHRIPYRGKQVRTYFERAQLNELLPRTA